MSATRVPLGIGLGCLFLLATFLSSCAKEAAGGLLASAGSAGQVSAPSGGSGAGGGSGVGSGGLGVVNGASGVVISEVMYHPVDELTQTDEHEFIELMNGGSATVSLSGWKLVVDGTERLTLPASASLAVGQYLVLAKSKQSLLAVTRYALNAEIVFGDYTGELDNGGATVAIKDASGQVVDAVAYDDEAPWPIGADAFGAQEEWLPALAPFTSHRFLGRSLTRVSAAASGAAPENWQASAVDGASPGRANGPAQEPQTIVLSASAAADGKPPGLIQAGETVRVRVALSGASTAPSLEYRLDLAEKTGAQTQQLPLQTVAGAPATFEAVLPGAAVNSIVRYRVLVRGASGALERTGPRPSDPPEWYAYFVNPPPVSGRTYQLFITPERWTSLWNNITPGQNTRCTVNPNWDATVPAVFVHEGKVYDVQVRYQGSRNRRMDGIELPTWNVPGPSAPAPLLVLSYRVKFPRYAEFEGQRAINLNKLKQACPGVLNSLEGALFESAGVVAQKFRFARLYINGAYYNYSMEISGIDERMMQAVEGKGNPVGELFKAEGDWRADTDRQAGPWGRADWGPLRALCSLTALQRYQNTYERQTHEWKGALPESHQELVSLIDQLNPIQADGDGDAAVRAYFQAHFDVPQLLTLVALRNWVGVWDDGTHNYYPYKRPADGKWQILPQDFDCDFGGDPVQCGDGGQWYNSPTLSFFHPETGDGVTAGGAPFRLKVELIKAFRPELAARVRELGTTLMSEANVNAVLAQVMQGFDMAAWNEAPAHYCDVGARVSQAQSFLRARRTFLAGGVR